MVKPRILSFFFDRQFQQTVNGYGYRENAKGPLLPLSEQEYEAMRPIASRRFLVAFALSFLSVIGMAFLFGSIFKNTLTNGQEALLTFPMMIIPVAVAYFSVRWSMIFPTKTLAGRSPLAPAVSKPKSRS